MSRVDVRSRAPRVESRVVADETEPSKIRSADLVRMQDLRRRSRDVDDDRHARLDVRHPLLQDAVDEHPEVSVRVGRERLDGLVVHHGRCVELEIAHASRTEADGLQVVGDRDFRRLSVRRRNRCGSDEHHDRRNTCCHQQEEPESLHGCLLRWGSRRAPSGGSRTPRLGDLRGQRWHVLARRSTDPAASLSGRGRRQPSQRRNTMQALCPPKPNEFETRDLDVRLARLVRDVVEVAVGIGRRRS